MLYFIDVILPGPRITMQRIKINTIRIIHRKKVIFYIRSYYSIHSDVALSTLTPFSKLLYLGPVN